MKLTLTGLVMTVVLALAGCAAAPFAPVTQVSSAPTDSAMPTPTPAPVVLSTIRMEATGLALLGGSGEDLGTIGFDDDPTQAVAGLTKALQSEPELIASYRMASSGWGVTVYRWGGLLLQVGLGSADPQEHYMGANFVEPYLGAIHLVGPGGVSVGDSMSEVPGPIAVGSYEGWPNEPRYLLGDPVPVTKYTEPYDEYVQGFDDSTTGTLAELIAPITSYGGPSWRRVAFLGL